MFLGIALTVVLATSAVTGAILNDHPEAGVVACLQPFLDSGDLKKVQVARVQRHYRLIVVPVDGDTARVTLLVTHPAGAAVRLQLSSEPREWTVEFALRPASLAPTCRQNPARG